MSGWPTNAAAHAHMRMRQQQNRSRSRRSPAENWMAAILKSTGLKWTRQAQSGYRIFDFWNVRTGIAIEVDGPEHNREVDLGRDAEIYQHRGIVIVRVRNFNEQDAREALATIRRAGSWNARRAPLGLKPVMGGE